MKKQFLFLGLLLTIPLLTGCGKLDTVDPTAHVYKTTEILLPTDDYAFTLDSTPRWDGERFVVTASRVDKEMGGTFVDNPKTYSFLPDGTDLQDITEKTTSATDMEPSQPGGWIDQTIPLDKKEMLVTEVVDTEKLYLSLRDEKGEVRFSLDLSKLFQVNYADVISGHTFFMVHGAVRTEEKGMVQYLVLTDGGLCAFDHTGELLWMLDTKQNPIALLDTDIGYLYLYGYTNQQNLCPVNPMTGELGEPIALPPELTGYGTEFMTGGGFDLYAATYSVLLGVNFTYDEEGNVTFVTETVVDWAASELARAELLDFAILDSETMVVLRGDQLHTTNFDYKDIYLLTHIPPEEVVIKETITIATLIDDGMLPVMVAMFNKSCETHRIVIKDYTIYEEDRRKTMFDADMAAGNVPDLVLFQEYSHMSLAESYEKAGLFTDLTSLMVADKTFAAEDLLGYVTKPYQKADGTQYVFPIYPSTQTVWGDKDYFDDPPTVAEVMVLLDTVSSVQELMPSERKLYHYIKESMFNEMVDTTAGTCRFDDGELARMIPILEQWQSTDSTKEDTLMTDGVRVTSLYNWVMCREEFGDRYIPIGWGNTDGKLYTEATFQIYLAITEKSAVKAQCFDFLELYLKEGHTEHDNRYYFRQQVYDKQAYYTDKTILLTSSGASTIQDELLNDGEYMAKYRPDYNPETTRKLKITTADAMEYIAFLDDIDAVMSTGSELYQIYNEELWEVENRTPEEVANAIQSRASIYLAETAD